MKILSHASAKKKRRKKRERERETERQRQRDRERQREREKKNAKEFQISQFYWLFSSDVMAVKGLIPNVDGISTVLGHRFLCCSWNL